MDRKDKERGQSLIEIAIILPILLLLLLGVAEVGMGLRNYLVVVNANREGARYAAHGRFGDDVTVATVLNAGGWEPYGTLSVPFLRRSCARLARASAALFCSRGMCRIANFSNFWISCSACLYKTESPGFLTRYSPRTCRTRS